MPESVSGVASQAARQAAAGSADVSAPTRAAAQQGAVNSVPPGSAGSPGGDLAPVPVQPARKASDAQAAQTPAQAAPLNRAAISAAFIERVASNREWRAALADNAQATGNCGVSEKACQELVFKAGQNEARGRMNFGEVIGRETVRLSPRRSSIFPGEAHVADAALAEERILDAYKNSSSFERGHINAAILWNREIRLPRQLSQLSDKVKKYDSELSQPQHEEARALIAITGRWVGEPRANDGPNLRDGQFCRLDFLLDSITISKPFNEDLYNLVVKKCRDEMGISALEESNQFNEIVARYRVRLRKM